MRTLFHFQYSPFSRRVRLALAYKELDCELREAREDLTARARADTLWPLHTIPVLVEEDGAAIGDSTAITRYLDAAYPNTPPLWPTDRESARAGLEVASLVDGALNLIVDLGTRYYALHEHGSWKGVQTELMGRAQRSLDALGARAAASGPAPITRHGWCAPDMWLFTLIAWLEGAPARRATSPKIAQVLTLPWSIPASLSRWAEAFRARSDVQAVEQSAL
jgi:glutathione S-transferase